MLGELRVWLLLLRIFLKRMGTDFEHFVLNEGASFISIASLFVVFFQKVERRACTTF